MMARVAAHIIVFHRHFESRLRKRVVYGHSAPVITRMAKIDRILFFTCTSLIQDSELRHKNLGYEARGTV